jgi:hypothetical protein
MRTWRWTVVAAEKGTRRLLLSLAWPAGTCGGGGGGLGCHRNQISLARAAQAGEEGNVVGDDTEQSPAGACAPV